MNLKTSEVRIGPWTIRPLHYGEMAYVAEHDEYTGTSRYPCFHGPTMDDVVSQITEWTAEESGEMAVAHE